jgi:hypothetical protein
MTNSRLIRENLCAVCHGRLVERWQQADRYVVVCAADPAHEGQVSQASVIAQQNEDRLRSSEVMGFYAGQFGLPQRDRERGSRALYGDDSPLV